MRAILLRSLIAALLVGPTIGFVNYVASIHGAIKYEPPLSEAELGQLRKLPMNETGIALQGRRIKLTRTQWLVDSIRYSYFWKYVAEISIVPSVGVFFACVWVGWLERRRARQVCAKHPTLLPVNLT